MREMTKYSYHGNSIRKSNTRLPKTAAKTPQSNPTTTATTVDLTKPSLGLRRKRYSQVGTALTKKAQKKRSRAPVAVGSLVCFRGVMQRKWQLAPNETQAQPRLRGTQVAAPGSTLATLDIQENDAV
jgi:hypothetical protein